MMQWKLRRIGSGLRRYFFSSPWVELKSTGCAALLSRLHHQGDYGNPAGCQIFIFYIVYGMYFPNTIQESLLHHTLFFFTCGSKCVKSVLMFYILYSFNTTFNCYDEPYQARLLHLYAVILARRFMKQDLTRGWRRVRRWFFSFAFRSISIRFYLLVFVYIDLTSKGSSIPVYRDLTSNDSSIPVYRDFTSNGSSISVYRDLTSKGSRILTSFGLLLFIRISQLTSRGRSTVR